MWSRACSFPERQDPGASPYPSNHPASTEIPLELPTLSHVIREQIAVLKACATPASALRGLQWGMEPYCQLVWHWEVTQ